MALDFEGLNVRKPIFQVLRHPAAKIDSHNKPVQQNIISIHNQLIMDMPFTTTYCMHTVCEVVSNPLHKVDIYGSSLSEPLLM